MVHALRIHVGVLWLAIAAPVNAAIIDVSGANLKAAFATVNDGDTLRVTGPVGSITLMGRNFASWVTIDATKATFTDTLTLKEVGGLKFVGGTFGSTTADMRAGRAVAVYNGDNIMFSGSKFVGNGLGTGLTMAGSSNISVSAGAFSGLKLGVGVSSSERIRVTSSRFTGMSSDGINFADSRFVTATANRCTGTVPAPGAHADCIQLWSVLGRPVQSDISLTNNIVSGMTQGLTSFDADKGGGLRITMTGNTISTSMPQGLACYGCFDSVFTGNVLTTLPGAQWRTSMNILGGGNNLIANNSVGAIPVSSPLASLAASLSAEGDFENYYEPLPDFVIEDMAYLAGLDVPGANRAGGLEEPQFMGLEAFSPAAAVPDVTTWTQLLIGFSLAGAAMRRRRIAASLGQATRPSRR